MEHSLFETFFSRIEKMGLPRIFLPIFVFIIGVNMSLFIFFSLNERNKQLDETHMRDLISDVTSSIRERVSIYENALRGGAALFASSHEVDAGEWKIYVQSTKILNLYQGIRGMGVVFPVSSKELENYPKSVERMGVSHFEIKTLTDQVPDADDSNHFIITYVEPLESNAAALGLDLSSEKKRREAIEAARDLNETIMTSPISLIQDEKKRSGFLLYYPFYKKEAILETVQDRRRALQGLIYAPFIAEEFFDAILKGFLRELDVSVFEESDMPSHGLLYSSHYEDNLKFDEQTQMIISGKKFSFFWKKTDAFIYANKMGALLITTSSFIITFLITWVLFSLMSINRKARELADEKTRELISTQSLLLESHKMEAVGKLASGVAHDFNNILAGILGYASLLKERLSGDDYSKSKLAVIIKSVERGSELTRQLLGFARKGKYEMKPVSIHQIVDEMVDLLAPTIGSSIMISKELSNKNFFVEGDSSQILQVFLNLGVNSRDAMPEGGKIRISTESVFLSENNNYHVPAGTYVHLSFEDTGHGVPQEIADKIYDPFFTTKEPGKGTGLGLAMIYGIMKTHGGTIFLDRDRSKGAAFHLYFPLLENYVPPIEEVKIIATEEKEDPLRLPFKGKKFLIADDEELILTWIQAEIESRGGSVYKANDGAQVVKIAENLKDEKIDMGIFDVVMPNKDGLAAYGEVRSHFPHMPIIFSSGYAESEKISKLRTTEHVFFLQKPFQSKDLVSLIQTISSQ